MYVVVTEAASQVAYHLLYLFANGDILEQQVFCANSVLFLEEFKEEFFY